jgi:hypothetical protein
MKTTTTTPATFPRLCAFLALAFGSSPLDAQQPDAVLRDEVQRGLKKAATYYRSKVASHGGYVYYYAADLSERWGEGKATADTIFVQPPGTPTVGRAYLRAYAATGDKFYLDAARETAEALVYGQLESGGWTQTIHFSTAQRMGKYRNGKGGSWNASSLDDDQTQAALLMLVLTDRALDFKHAAIHEAAQFGLKALLAAQFPNGAFPQVWTGPVEKKPVVAAKFPDYDWKTVGRVKDYWNYYTLNDGLAGTVAEILITAHEVYKDPACKAALEKLGDFLILAQMPAPQPGWCQQYSYDMVPIWARKFEPPAITGWESQDAMETLLKVFRHTGAKKYLEPIPRALEYLKKYVLPDGRVARYYELRTNKPLYMDSSYQLTYDDSAAPAHYAWKQPSHLGAIEKAYLNAKAGRAPESVPPDRDGGKKVRAILAALDAEGCWISTYSGERLTGQPKLADGFRYISSDVFSRNVGILSDYVDPAKK